MDLKLEQVRSAVRQSGRHPGVEYWVGKPAADALTTSTIWLNLPTGSHMTIMDMWPKLQDPQVPTLDPPVPTLDPPVPTLDPPVPTLDPKVRPLSSNFRPPGANFRRQL